MGVRGLYSLKIAGLTSHDLITQGIKQMFEKECKALGFLNFEKEHGRVY